MNQQQLEKYLTKHNNKLRERLNRNRDFRLSRLEGEELNKEAKKRIERKKVYDN